MAVEFVVLMFSWLFLLTILKMFFAPDDDPFGKISEVEVVIFLLAILAYFQGFDPFPANLPGPFAGLHIITIGVINAMAMIDLFAQTVFNVPLSMDLLFGVLLPAFISYGLCRSFLQYTGTISDNTVKFASFMVAFLTLMAVKAGYGGGFNLAVGVTKMMQFFIGLIAVPTGAESLAGPLFGFMAGIFFLGLIIGALSLFLEAIAAATMKAMLDVEPQG